MITIKGSVYKMPLTTNYVTVLPTSPNVYARAIGSTVSIYTDSSNPVFNSTYGQWVNATNLEPYVGTAISGSMETKPYLVRSMFNEPPVSGEMMHFAGDIPWDGTPAIIAEESIVLIPGDVLDAVSTTSAGYSGGGTRDYNHNLTWNNIVRSQFIAIQGGVGVCIPSTVVLSVPWQQTTKGASLQTMLRRGSGGGNMWRPGSGSIDKTTFTIKRNY